MGFCTSGSLANTVALKPVGIFRAAAASAGDIGDEGSFSLLYGAGKSDAPIAPEMLTRRLSRDPAPKGRGFILWMGKGRYALHACSSSFSTSVRAGSIRGN